MLMNVEIDIFCECGIITGTVINDGEESSAAVFACHVCGRRYLIQTRAILTPLGELCSNESDQK